MLIHLRTAVLSAPGYTPTIHIRPIIGTTLQILDMADQTGEALCVMYTNAGTLTCSGCHDIQYCSKDCQKTDWPLHKLVCKD